MFIKERQYMKKIVIVPSDPIHAYIKEGFSEHQLNDYFNPQDYFDEVYCLSPWQEPFQRIGNILCIKAHPRNFSKIIMKIRPDVVRGYDGCKCADWLTVNRVAGIPIVISAHDKRSSWISDSLKYADGVIYISNAVRDAITEKVDIEAERLYMLPNCINTDVFSPKSDSAYFSMLNTKYGSGKHILHVGRKAVEKNLDTVIRALTFLAPEYSCLFVGKGNTSYYESLAKSLGVADRCFFIQSIANEELPYYYSWCDCMCTPSLTEGFGIVFIEAAACGAVIVTSDIIPMNEYLTNGESAILVKDFQNPQKIAAAISLASEKNVANSNIKRAARQVGLKFSKNNISQYEIDIYKRIISQNTYNVKNRTLRTLRKVWLYPY